MRATVYLHRNKKSVISHFINIFVQTIRSQPKHRVTIKLYTYVYNFNVIIGLNRNYSFRHEVILVALKSRYQNMKKTIISV